MMTVIRMMTIAIGITSCVFIPASLVQLAANVGTAMPIQETTKIDHIVPIIAVKRFYLRVAARFKTLI